MLKVRLQFEKTGQSRFISHLDLMHMLQRAFARARLPLAFTEGFNPHPYLSIARPLPVGVSSVCEILDFGLAEEMDWDTLPKRISDVLPLGVKIRNACPAVRNVRDIAWATYQFRLRWDEPCPPDTADRIAALFDGRPLMVSKKSKRQEREIDVAPHVKDMSCTLTSNTLTLDAVLAAGEVSINPLLLLKAMANALPDILPSCATDILRTTLLDGEGNVFS